MPRSRMLFLSGPEAEKVITYALALDGKLIQGTVTEYRADAWNFKIVAVILGPVWRAKYWNRLRASKRSAAKHGFQVVKVVVVIEDALLESHKEDLGYAARQYVRDVREWKMAK